MKESVKAARIELGSLALQALYAASDAADPIKIPELFEPDAECDAATRGESRNRKWQQHMMAQLKAAGVVDGDEGRGFNTVDRKHLQKIIANLDEDKLLLSNFIFTSFATDPDLAGVPMEPAGSDNPLGRMSETLVDLVGAIETNHKTFREILGRLLTAAEEGTDVDATVGRLEERFNRTNSRIDKLEGRVADVLRVAEAMQTTLKTIAAALTELSAASKTVAGAASAMTSAAASLDTVSKQISESEQDKFGRLVRGLKAHLEEGKALHDAALELVAKAS